LGIPLHIQPVGGSDSGDNRWLKVKKVPALKVETATKEGLLLFRPQSIILTWEKKIVGGTYQKHDVKRKDSHAGCSSKDRPRVEKTRLKNKEKETSQMEKGAREKKTSEREQIHQLM